MLAITNNQWIYQSSDKLHHGMQLDARAVKAQAKFPEGEKGSSSSSDSEPSDEDLTFD
jgi:hypothetical protein